MESPKPALPKINPEDRTALVDVLLELFVWQDKRIDELEQKILKLKGETTFGLFFTSLCSGFRQSLPECQSCDLCRCL